MSPQYEKLIGSKTFLQGNISPPPPYPYQFYNCPSIIFFRIFRIPYVASSAGKAPGPHRDSCDCRPSRTENSLFSGGYYLHGITYTCRFSHLTGLISGLVSHARLGQIPKETQRNKRKPKSQIELPALECILYVPCILHRHTHISLNISCMFIKN